MTGIVKAGFLSDDGDGSVGEPEQRFCLADARIQHVFGKRKSGEPFEHFSDVSFGITVFAGKLRQRRRFSCTVDFLADFVYDMRPNVFAFIAAKRVRAAKFFQCGEKKGGGGIGLIAVEKGYRAHEKRFEKYGGGDAFSFRQRYRTHRDSVFVQKVKMDVNDEQRARRLMEGRIKNIRRKKEARAFSDGILFGDAAGVKGKTPDSAEYRPQVIISEACGCGRPFPIRRAVADAAGIDFELHIDWSFVNSCFAGRSIVFFS